MAFEKDRGTGYGRVTDAPAVGPTMPPAFNLQYFAHGSSLRGGMLLSPDTVLELVPDVSWSSASLDDIEMNVVRQIDGISPVSLLQSMLGMSHDELQVMLAMLLARQMVTIVPAATRSGVWHEEVGSGVFRAAAAVDQDTDDEDSLLARTG